MFTPDERSRLRDELVSAAERDPAVGGLALTGSASVGREDRWSDVDLALCAADGTGPDVVADAWTGRMYDEHGAVDHLDVYRGPVLYRVFLLVSTLQVDLSFWPSDAFGATGPAFRLVFGEAVDFPHTPPPDPGELVGTAWLYALHVRSSLRRGRVWSAHWSLAGMRDAVLALACLRHGTVPVQARGIDDLAADVRADLTATVPTSLDPADLHRAFVATTEALITEAHHTDHTRATRLAPLLRELAA